MGREALFSAIWSNTNKSRLCHTFGERSGAIRLGRVRTERKPQVQQPLQFLGCVLLFLHLALSDGVRGATLPFSLEVRVWEVYSEPTKPPIGRVRRMIHNATPPPRHRQTVQSSFEALRICERILGERDSSQFSLWNRWLRGQLRHGWQHGAGPTTRWSGPSRFVSSFVAAAIGLSSRTCRCGRLLDVLGHHRAACGD